MWNQLLQIHNVCKSYTTTLKLLRGPQRKTDIIRDISFSINEKDSIGLVGKSGCGKSTLTRLLVQLELPDSGSIQWNKQNIANLSRKKLRLFRKDCQLIHQDSLSAFNPMLKMKDSLLEPLKNYFQLPNKAGIQQIESMLPVFHLDKQQLARFPHELSGGQRQRFNILRALLVQPKLLICDEITTGLDKVTETIIISLLKKIQESSQMAILFISHDLRLVQQVSQTIHIMRNGTIVETVENSQGQFNFQHQYSKKLFQSLPITHPKYRQVDNKSFTFL